MKSFSVKLDQNTFEETEKIIAELKLERNGYINQAINSYNQLNQRILLSNKLRKESKMVAQSSFEILADFEHLADVV